MSLILLLLLYEPMHNVKVYTDETVTSYLRCIYTSSSRYYYSTVTTDGLRIFYLSAVVRDTTLCTRDAHCEVLHKLLSLNYNT